MLWHFWDCVLRHFSLWRWERTKLQDTSEKTGQCQPRLTYPYANIRSVNVIAAEKVKLQLSWLKEVLCELSLLKIFSYQGLNMINWEARGRPITLRNYIILKKIINAYYFQKRIVLNLISILFFCRSLQVVTQIWKTDKLKIVVNPTRYILHFLSLVVSKLLAGSLIEIIRALKSMKNN